MVGYFIFLTLAKSQTWFSILSSLQKKARNLSPSIFIWTDFLHFFENEFWDSAINSASDSKAIFTEMLFC